MTVPVRRVDVRPGGRADAYTQVMTARWQIEFCETADGRAPVEEWLLRLAPTKRRAAAAALEMVLAVDGLAVCATPWGKHLGQALLEFRIRHTESEIRGIRGEETAGPAIPGSTSRAEAVLRRFFCHAHGNRVILLLAAYDKGRDPSAKREQREIAEARRRLREFRRRGR